MATFGNRISYAPAYFWFSCAVSTSSLSIELEIWTSKEGCDEIFSAFLCCVFLFPTCCSSSSSSSSSMYHVVIILLLLCPPVPPPPLFLIHLHHLHLFPLYLLLLFFFFLSIFSTVSVSSTSPSLSSTSLVSIISSTNASITHYCAIETISIAADLGCLSTVMYAACMHSISSSTTIVYFTSSFSIWLSLRGAAFFSSFSSK